MNVTLRRFGDTPFGTFGRLQTEAGFHCYTVERSWLDNAPWISCIPTGSYELVPTRYHRMQLDTWEVWPVKNRSRILIHPGNTWNDVQGCIAVGSSLGWVGGNWAVVDSRRTFGNLCTALNVRSRQRHRLVIEDGTPMAKEAA